MAYLVGIISKCDYGGCSSKACVELRNNSNGSCGYFCRKHGERKKRELDQREREAATQAERSRRAFES